MKARFYEYGEIPVLMQEYLTFVADVNTITDLPIEEINEYLRGLDDFEFDAYKRERYEEYSDGWV